LPSASAIQTDRSALSPNEYGRQSYLSIFHRALLDRPDGIKETLQPKPETTSGLLTIEGDEIPLHICDDRHSFRQTAERT
jgi:hypothetical protein